MPKYNVSAGQRSSDREILPLGMVLASLAKPQSLCFPTKTWSFACKQPSETSPQFRAQVVEVSLAVGDIHVGWQVTGCSRPMDPEATIWSSQRSYYYQSHSYSSRSKGDFRSMSKGNPVRWEVPVCFLPSLKTGENRALCLEYVTH